jgi:competence protein ComEC
VNQIDWAIATTPHPNSDWQAIQTRLPIKQIYDHPALPRPGLLPRTTNSSPNPTPLVPHQVFRFGTSQIQFLTTTPSVVQLTFGDRGWLWLDETFDTQAASANKSLPQTEVLWWSGKALSPNVLNQIHPKIAIASGKKVDEKTAIVLKKLNTQIYSTGQDGAIQWTPSTGFKSTLNQNSTPF